MGTVADPRTRIMDAALRLMSEQGSSGASMRQLAAASSLNVATIYHYFPSKTDLLGALLEHRHYGERLAVGTPPIPADATPRERLVALLRWLWEGALDEEQVWRLLIGEALRGEARATTSARQLVESIDGALTIWLRDFVPELQGGPGVAARVVRAQLFSLVVEHLAVGPVAPADAATRAEELAALLLPA